MAERKGGQTPTQSVILPYKNTYGLETVKFYNSCGNMAMPWQELLISDVVERQTENSALFNQRIRNRSPPHKGLQPLVCFPAVGYN